MRLPLAGLALAALLLGGCNKERIPYLHHWTGGLVVSDADPVTPVDAIVPKGYLQLYRTDDQFLIEFQNRNQMIDLKGTWKIVGKRRIQLAFKDFHVTEPDIDKLRAMRRPFLDPADLRAAFSQTMVLDLSPDGQKLTGLSTHLGPLRGQYVFEQGL